MEELKEAIKRRGCETTMLPMLFYRIKDVLWKVGDNWDKLAPDKESAIEYAHTHINNDPMRMIAGTQRYSMEYCLAHSGESINERCRANQLGSIEKAIADMVNTYFTDTDLVLYRGVCDHVYELMIENARGIAGCDFVEKGFLATSLVKNHELLCKKRLRIYVPKGTHVVYQGNVNYEQHFYEVDVQRGAKLKIISADKTYINCKLIATD